MYITYNSVYNDLQASSQGCRYLDRLLLSHFQRPGEATEAVRPGLSDGTPYSLGDPSECSTACFKRRVGHAFS